MSEEYHAIKWIDENTATRFTKEVSLMVQIMDGGTAIMLSGTADLEHHLVEDSLILLKKVAEVKCGGGH